MMLPAHAYARLVNPLPCDRRRPALFLDRDGVINLDVGYLHRIEDLVVLPGIAARIAAARRDGWETVIVTNQSGIGRGYYGWDAFETLQAEIYRRLLAEDSEARIGMVCASPFLPGAAAPYGAKDHPWRKPNPGMLLYAADALDIELESSLMIGDSASDEAAAAAAGVPFQYA